jgi:hypothetical protein
VRRRVFVLALVPVAAALAVGLTAVARRSSRTEPAARIATILPQPVTRRHGRCSGGGILGTQGSLGGVPIPESPEIFRITSIWHAARHGIDVDVHAGSLVQQPNRGVLNVTWTNPTVWEPLQGSGTFLAPAATGPLVLTCIARNTVAFAFRGGRGTFDLKTRRFHLTDVG